MNEYVKAWQHRNPEKMRAARRKQRRDRREEKRLYRLRHPEYDAHKSSRRRARIGGNGGTHTIAEWLEKKALFAGLCAYCGEGGQMTRDHMIPLFRGGTNDIGNVVPACRRCNFRKGTKTAAEFLTQLDRERSEALAA